MHTVTSFHASAVDPERLNGIMEDYLAAEEARTIRRMLVMRCGILALVIAVAGLGLHWLPTFASWLSVAIFLVPPVTAWIVELKRESTLALRLEGVPGSISNAVEPASAPLVDAEPALLHNKVIKSS